MIILSQIWYGGLRTFLWVTGAIVWIGFIVLLVVVNAIDWSFKNKYPQVKP